MEGNTGPFLNKLSTPQFKKKGSNKKGKWNNSRREQSFGDPHASDTVYCILCHSRKIGSVIGKAGTIVKALREETEAKITVADSVPGSDERVIIICSPSIKIPRKHNSNSDDGDPATEKEDNVMEPHCAAQDALLKVHDRIVDEDIFGQTENADNNENVIMARLLVPKSMVGCLLGKKGDVIQRLRNETGAGIRVLPAEHLPTCARSTDELVQISGRPAVAKKALYEVSTLLHQNPRKDKPHSSFPMPYGGQGFNPPGPPMEHMPPPGNPVLSQRNNSHGMPPMPWMGGYGNPHSGFGSGGVNDVPAPHGGEAPKEFSMKILCPAGKIGGVIGKGGSNVKQLQQETEANIHVEDVSAESDERVIRVFSFEALRNPRSQTIDAILQLQNKTSEYSEKGVITTRLLVPSSKVGCILGQGGQVINEMRRRMQVDIRVYSKEEKPKCAAQDEELVQISGNFGVARDALAEIASRLRARCLRDANAGVEPAPSRPVPVFSTAGNVPGGRPPPPGPIGAGSPGGYEFFKGGGLEYEPPSYPVPPSATRYPNFNSSLELRIPNYASGPVVGTRGRNIGEIAGTRVKLQDRQSGGSECVVDIRGSSEHLNAATNIFQAFAASAGPNYSPQQGSYQTYNAQQDAYPNINASQPPYQSVSAQQAPYQTIPTQPAPYQNISSQGSYYY